MDNPKFSCAHCGSQEFNVTSKAQGDDDLAGAICANCGAELTEDDIRTQGRKMVDDLIKPFRFKKTIDLKFKL